MSRIRSVHPGLFTDEAFMSASPLGCLLMIGIWTEAWDDGVFEWKPVTLKAKILPAANADVAALLEELAALDMVQSFQSGGKKYGVIRNFRKFQRPKFPNSSGFLPDHLRSYVGLTDAATEELPQSSGSATEKAAQVEDGVVEGRGEEKIELKNHSRKPTREFKPFPADGSIAYSEPWRGIVKKRKPRADPDAIASPFRGWCHQKGIPFDRPDIAQVFDTFCVNHKIPGLNA